MTSDDTPAAVPPGPVVLAGPNPGYTAKQRNILVCCLLEIVTFGVYGCFWIWHTQEDVKRRSGDGVGGWLGLVIYLVIGIVTVFLVPAEIKRMHEREGLRPPFSAWLGLWNLVPIAGPVIWFVKVQRAMNRFWAGDVPSAAATA